MVKGPDGDKQNSQRVGPPLVGSGWALGLSLRLESSNRATDHSIFADVRKK